MARRLGTRGATARAAVRGGGILLVLVGAMTAWSGDTGALPATAAGALPATAPAVVIAALFPDGFAADDLDEAIELWNVGGETVGLGGWSVSDGEGSVTFPSGASLPSDGRVWLARDAGAFTGTFGHAPDWSWSRLDRGVKLLATLGGGPALANDGDEVVLRRGNGALVDAVAYGDGAAPGGWVGPPVRPYRTASISASGQVLYRKLDPAAGAPIADTDRLADWSSDPGDVALGRRVRHPAWALETRLVPAVARGQGRVEVAVAPDALFGFLQTHLGGARSSIDLMVYTLEHPVLAETIAVRAREGVRVRVLLDGAPVGGVSLEERWCVTRIVAAGGSVWWMDDGGEIRARYRSMHAKVALIDGRRALIGSENPGTGAAPVDDLADGVAGRRGVYIATDSPGVVAWARALLDEDIDPEHHADVRPFQARDPGRGAPPPDFVPAPAAGMPGPSPVAPVPLVVTGDIPFELITAPENALAPGAGLLGLLARAGEGDEVRVEQLSEPVWWGGGPAEGEIAANPRVAGYLAAARRGARVRVLLDGYFGDPGAWNNNAATVRLLNATARGERLDLRARLGNPAGLGIHNKMVLVALTGGHPAPGAYVVHVGSLNGTEVAHKVNREVAVQIDHRAAYDYLARVFDADWATTNALAVPWAAR
jgi:cardiolipin synthase A/B